jgi:DNA polymerase III subunit alpha
VFLCAMTPEWGEVDLLIEDDFPVSPQVKGAFRSLPGVIEVEEI